MESELEILVLRILERLKAEELVSKIVHVRGQSDEERAGGSRGRVDEIQDCRSLGSLPPEDLRKSSPDNTRGMARSDSRMCRTKG